ncbi:MAG: PAS domain S-box-containing protein, partial [Paraglaciecola sp.]
MLNQFGEKRDHLVLIVDDTPSTLIVMREILQAEGFRVEEAADGVIAMEAFHRCQPDVVLLDIEMPRKNGFEVCTEIRASDSGHRTPVIMTTGTNDVSAVQRAYDTGASDFISKPINWAVLAYKLRYVLRASDAIAKQHKAALMISGLAGVIENSSNEIYILEKENLTFQDVNLSARVNLGYDADEFYGLTIYDLISGISPVEFVEYLEPLWNGTSKQVDLELEIKRKNGSYYHAYLHLYAFAHEENLSLVIIGQDISERKEADKHMRYLAYFDNLTSLPNRRQFTEELEVMLEVANRRSQQLALLFIDMDNFKRINDTLGHSIGDLLLCEVGVRLVESVRASDRKSPDRSRVADISVSRLGGDEFTVVISHINH